MYITHTHTHTYTHTHTHTHSHSQIPVVLYHGSVQERESLRRNMFKPAPKPKQQQQTQHRRSGGGRKSSSSSSSHPPTLTPSHPSPSSSLPEDLLPVVVTSYEICMRDQRFLQHRSWKFLVVDEGHRIKNLNCKLIKSVLGDNAAFGTEGGGGGALGCILSSEVHYFIILLYTVPHCRMHQNQSQSVLV